MPHSAESSAEALPASMGKTSLTTPLVTSLPKLSDAEAGPKVTFGRAMRSAHFSFAESHIPVNHGSFGATPSAVLRIQDAVRARSEARPDVFVHYELPPAQDAARGLVADLLGASSDEVVFVPNASTGTDTILRSLKFKQGDVILYMEATYGALEKAILYTAEMTPVTAHKLEIHWPISDDELVEKYTKELAKINATPGKRVALAITDTIMSVPGLRVPWERLVAATKSAGALSLVDGAHGIGHIPLTHLRGVDPDFFTSNLHKWLHVPRPCAVLYVPERNQRLVRSTLPTSHGFMPESEASAFANPLAREPGQTPISDFAQLFGFVATNDYSSQLAVGAALQWRAFHGGEEAIMAHCAKVGQSGADRAAKILNTHVMDAPNSSGRKDIAMANVRLPINLKDMTEKEKEGVVPYVKRRAALEKDAYVQALLYRDNIYWRVSGQVYIEEEEFEEVARYLKGLCERIDDGRWKEELKREVEGVNGK